MEVINIIEKLKKEQTATKEELVFLLENITDEELKVLRRKAQVTAIMNFRKDIYIRGLIEISNYCKNDCLYCGIRRSNKNAVRYRLTKEQILSCCDLGYELGFRTFVMQGGEDPYFTDEVMCDIIHTVKSKYPDCAITLSLGERGKESFKRLPLEKYAAAASDERKSFIFWLKGCPFLHSSSFLPASSSILLRTEGSA